MVPLAMAAAFGAAKLNELRFSNLREQWRDQRSYDRVCCSIDLSWCAQQMTVDRAYGSSSLDQETLMRTFYDLQSERNDCMMKLIALHGELPFTRFPFQTIAKVRECWHLRSHLQKLSREIDRPLYRGQMPLLAAPPDLAGEVVVQTAQSPTSDSTFLARCSTSWLLDHTSKFRSRSYQNCIAHLKTPQLDALNAQLQFCHKERVEQIWGQMVKRTEKLTIAMAILQTGFLGAIRLSFGSVIAAHCLKQMQAQELAKILFASSRIFGVASLISAIAMGFAVRRYGALLNANVEKVKSIGQIKGRMEHLIGMIRERRFQEIALAGLELLNRRERRLRRMGEQIAREAQRLARMDQMIEELGGKNNEQGIQLLGQDGKLGEQGRKLDEQDHKLDEQRGKLGEQGRKLNERERELGEHKEKLDEQGRKLNERERELGEHKEKLDEQGRKLDEGERELGEQGRKLDERERELGEYKEKLADLTDKFKTLETLLLARVS